MKRAPACFNLLIPQKATKLQRSRSRHQDRWYHRMMQSQLKNRQLKATRRTEIRPSTSATGVAHQSLRKPSSVVIVAHRRRTWFSAGFPWQWARIFSSPDLWQSTSVWIKRFPVIASSVIHDPNRSDWGNVNLWKSCLPRIFVNAANVIALKVTIYVLLFVVLSHVCSKTLGYSRRPIQLPQSVHLTTTLSIPHDHLVSVHAQLHNHIMFVLLKLLEEYWLAQSTFFAYGVHELCFFSISRLGIKRLITLKHPLTDRKESKAASAGLWIPKIARPSTNRRIGNRTNYNCWGSCSRPIAIVFLPHTSRITLRQAALRSTDTVIGTKLS